ncbi:glutaredoxin 3 [Rhodobacteraceae bacterium]|nr:glutaredoxin 3 [Paracoccaceae bacterium]
MQRVEIYTTRTCPFCVTAKRLLDGKNVSYEETDVGGDPAVRQAMMARANGRRSVPQIFIGDTHVGGCDELQALDRSGKLDTLLAG